MKKVGIIGATGYAGAELVRLLLSHPEVGLTALSSVSFEGKPISEIYPALYKICDDTLISSDGVINSCDVVFASLPHGLSQEIAAGCAKKGALFIDLGADFRLESADLYKEWYGCEYTNMELHDEAVYGLPEMNYELIREAKIIGNPGCYPTSAALALYPALSNDAVSTEGIIIDAKSGVTGAGRSPAQNSHFPELNEAFYAYKAGAHRHTPEIEQTLSQMAGTDVKITFVPHLLPVNRGILSTIYLKKRGKSLDELHELYRDFYEDTNFVRVLPVGKYADIKQVKYSNYCDISLHEDKHTGTIIICSAIDNMVKGAAGQAIQNMNIALGLDETCGLKIIPPSF
jgi:N-acetyl-gamma-glutamyl-phosphate reductase